MPTVAQSFLYLSVFRKRVGTPPMANSICFLIYTPVIYHELYYTYIHALSLLFCLASNSYFVVRCRY